MSTVLLMEGMSKITHVLTSVQRALLPTSRKVIEACMQLVSSEVNHSKTLPPFGRYAVILLSSNEERVSMRPSYIYNCPRVGGSVSLTISVIYFLLHRLPWGWVLVWWSPIISILAKDLSLRFSNIGIEVSTSG